jgi:hypothetical protein
MPSGNTSDEGLSYEKSGASMGESARTVAILQRSWNVLCRLVVARDLVVNNTRVGDFGL